ncbi:MAG: ATP-binding protein, partial [Gammaproteobacteria bacterium]
VSNAIEAMPRGGELRLRARTRAGGVAIAVEDTGPGMTREETQRALSGGYSRKEHGTGMGLVLSRHIMEKLGGTLDIESTPGRGTCIELFFPASICGTWKEAALP